jgi:rare lipoprotein A
MKRLFDTRGIGVCGAGISLVLFLIYFFIISSNPLHAQTAKNGSGSLIGVGAVGQAFDNLVQSRKRGIENNASGNRTALAVTDSVSGAFTEDVPDYVPDYVPDDSADEPTAAPRPAGGNSLGSGALRNAEGNTDIVMIEEGIASWYGGQFHGRLTANGETFDMNALTAAHRTLPFNSIVRVVRQDTEQSVIVRINDRGPFVDNRVIDLSRAAADSLGITGTGIAPVRLEILHLQQETVLRTVQVGSFSRRANAEKVVVDLREAGLEPTIESSSEGLHRVILQGIRESLLDEYRQRLAALGHPEVLVRRK